MCRRTSESISNLACICNNTNVHESDRRSLCRLQAAIVTPCRERPHGDVIVLHVQKSSHRVPPSMRVALRKTNRGTQRCEAAITHRTIYSAIQKPIPFTTIALSAVSFLPRPNIAGAGRHFRAFRRNTIGKAIVTLRESGACWTAPYSALVSTAELLCSRWADEGRTAAAFVWLSSVALFVGAAP